MTAPTPRASQEPAQRHHGYWTATVTPKPRKGLLARLWRLLRAVGVLVLTIVPAHASPSAVADEVAAQANLRVWLQRTPQQVRAERELFGKGRR